MVGPAIEFLLEKDLLWAIIIFLSALAIAEIVNILLKSIVSVFTSKTKTSLDDDIAHAIKKPLFLVILLIGLHYAVLSIDLLQPYQNIISKATLFLAIILAYAMVTGIAKALVKWYSLELYPKISNGSEHKNLTIFKMLFDIIIFVVFFVIMLRFFGVSITPLIASLGIGGLAVALALQQTLGDFIAGISILGDKSIRIGDYVELDSGGSSPLAGYIEDISWRASRIRTLGNNYVIVPNTKLAQSIATDYHFGTPETTTGVTLYISYKSDLDKVEKIVNKVAKDVQNGVEGAVKGYEPQIRFKEFQDSNIMGTVYLKVTDFTNQWSVKHEFIKRIKKEFEKNKIEISYPQRVVHLKK